MSVEQQPTGAERRENQAELEAMANERLKELAEKSAETRVEQSPDRRAEEVREKLALQQDSEPEPAPTGEQQVQRPAFVAQLDRALNFSQTLASVQRKLSPVSRSFSKVIHQPAVEKTSEALEKTVMRPSVTLGATWTALLVGLTFYLVSRHYGYAMSGSEMLFALVAGGILGVLLEFVFRIFRRRS